MRPQRHHARGSFTRANPATGVSQSFDPLQGRPTNRAIWPAASREYRDWLKDSDPDGYRRRMEVAHETD